MGLKFWSSLTSDASVSPLQNGLWTKILKVCHHAELCLWPQDIRGHTMARRQTTCVTFLKTCFKGHHWRWCQENLELEQTGNAYFRILLPKTPDQMGIKKEQQWNGIREGTKTPLKFIQDNFQILPSTINKNGTRFMDWSNNSLASRRVVHNRNPPRK